MIGKIKYIADIQGFCQYERCVFDQFISWLWQQKSVQLDIETNGNKDSWWNEIKIISMQFGSCTPDRVQWFLQWSELTEPQKMQIQEYLESQLRCKLIHNAAYEYIVCRFHGIIIENVYDTMLGEKVIRGGMEIKNYALSDISWKYLRIIMDKTLQTSFADNLITEAKILYGITDVAYLDAIRKEQLSIAGTENLLNVLGLEMEAVLTFSDITFEGMILDKEKWRENIELAKPLAQQATKTMNAWVQGPMRGEAISRGFISDRDRVVINYNSIQQKNELLNLIFPDLDGSSQPKLKAYIRDNAAILGEERLELLLDIQVKQYDKLQQYLLMYHKEYLIEKGFVIPAGTVTINWGSPVQALPMLQLLVPKLTGTGKDERGKFVHQVLTDFENYGKYNGLLTDYGESWIEKYCGPDGYVRTNFNQIVSTGRSSSNNPNLQNVIVSEEVGTRYRNAFTCEPGWEFVDSDFTGQELALIAYTCKDPLWMGAIMRGEDLHSICAEVVYKQKWKDATEPDCAFYAMVVGAEGKLKRANKKCDCKKHKPLRYDVKTINFMLAYGGTEIKLASELNISRKEAIALIDEYFKAFPGIKTTLDFLGHFGVINGYIMTLFPFNRKRWFPYWKEYIAYRDAHIQGIKYIPVLGEIERASKNHPFQGEQTLPWLNCLNSVNPKSKADKGIPSQATFKIKECGRCNDYESELNNNLSHEKAALLS